MDCTINQQPAVSMEEYLAAQAKVEDQMDYEFIQRILQEVTQSCALPMPLPAAAIPPLVLQAAQWFWENDDFSSEERWYCLPYKEIQKCGPNKLIKLPSQIIGVHGLYPTRTNFNYGVMGDFSLERMILNNSALASGVGGSLSDVFGTGTGYRLTDVVAALYEVETYKAVFDCPVTYNFNPYSHDLIILGALRPTDLILNTWQRCKIQDLYQNYYFFRYCVCLAKRSLAQIVGTFDFKLPGGVTLNHSAFKDAADTEITEIQEWVRKNHATDYFYNTNTI